MQHGKSVLKVRSQRETREGEDRSGRMADRSVVAKKPGNAGGAKGP